MISLRKADGSFPSEDDPFSMMFRERAGLGVAADPDALNVRDD